MNRLLSHKKEMAAFWIELQRETFLRRGYALANGFQASFFVQCIESTTADGYEVFIEAKMEHNYFKQHVHDLDERSVARFFKLAAIHHTIRMMKRRKKELIWDEMKRGLFFVFGLGDEEQQMTEVLYRCALLYQTGFQELFLKTTARYVFNERTLDAFSFAFIGNFWYNSYSSFMGSFTGYVPFQVCLERAANV